jgi:hypothetical protein
MGVGVLMELAIGGFVVEQNHPLTTADYDQV